MFLDFCPLKWKKRPENWSNFVKSAADCQLRYVSLSMHSNPRATPRWCLNSSYPRGHSRTNYIIVLIRVWLANSCVCKLSYLITFPHDCTNCNEQHSSLLGGLTTLRAPVDTARNVTRAVIKYGEWVRYTRMITWQNTHGLTCGAHHERPTRPVRAAWSVRSRRLCAAVGMRLERAGQVGERPPGAMDTRVTQFHAELRTRILHWTPAGVRRSRRAKTISTQNEKCTGRSKFNQTVASCIAVGFAAVFTMR